MSTKTNHRRLAQQNTAVKFKKEEIAMQTQSTNVVAIENEMKATVTSMDVTPETTVETNQLRNWLENLEVNFEGVTTLDIKNLTSNAVITALNLPTSIPKEVVNETMIRLESIATLVPYLPMVKGMLVSVTSEEGDVQVEPLLNMVLPIIQTKISTFIQNVVRYLDLIKAKLNSWLEVDLEVTKPIARVELPKKPSITSPVASKISLQAMAEKEVTPEMIISIKGGEDIYQLMRKHFGKYKGTDKYRAIQNQMFKISYQ